MQSAKPPTHAEDAAEQDEQRQPAVVLAQRLGQLLDRERRVGVDAGGSPASRAVRAACDQLARRRSNSAIRP